MFCLSLLLLLVPQVAGAPVQEAVPPTTQPTYDEGPLRAELIAMREIRFTATDPEMASRLRSELGMQFRVRGERIAQIVKQGNLIFTDLVDDTGESLLDPNTYSEADKTSTRIVMVPPERLRTDGLIVTTRNKPSARGAKVLAKVLGSIRLILADQPEKYTLVNPLQFYGKTIEDPRLKQLGIEIELVPLDQIDNPPPGNRGIIFRYKAKGEHIQRASFVDGAMKPIAARETTITTKAGDPCPMYYFEGTAFNDEMQLVLEVHPQVDDVRVPVELDNVNLP